MLRMTSPKVTLSPYFNPHLGEARPCWHCSYFEAMVYGGTAALCKLANAPRVRSGPEHGCSAFVREPGTDDAAEPPPSLDTLPALVSPAAQPKPVPWAP